ncbi:unnamed protein product [Lampetra fluviatilis]
MEGKRKWKLLVPFIIIITFFIMGFTTRFQVGHLGFLHLPQMTQLSPELHPKSPMCAPDTYRESMPDVQFHRVGSTKILAFSAYLDVREDSHDLIRVFALAPTRTLNEHVAVACRMVYWQEELSPWCANVSAEATMLSNHYFFEYAVFNFLCRIPKGATPPSHVALVVKGQDDDTSTSTSSVLMPVQNRQPALPKQHFGVCLPTFFNSFNNVLLFVQSMECYRLLGAGFVTVYNSSVSPQMDAVLRHYMRSGFVDVLQWPITDFLKPSTGWNINVDPGDLHYYGQIATMNDCMYRNMYRARYLTMHDVDEIVVPRKWYNWTQMMEELDEPKISAYYFRMHNFPVVETALWTSRSGYRAQGTNILDHVVKVTYPPNELASKTIVQPRGVQFQDVHQVLALRPGYGIKRVPDNEAVVQHYKSWKKIWNYPSSSELIQDTNLLKYSEVIEKRVKRVLDNLGKL